MPADTASLRFPMQPTVQPAPTSQVANGLSPQAPTSTNAAAAPNQGVMLASYNAPASSASQVPAAVPANPNSPWRTPQYNGITPSPSYPQQANAAPSISPQLSMPTAPAYPIAQAPITLPTNPMAVDLRGSLATSTGRSDAESSRSWLRYAGNGVGRRVPSPREHAVITAERLLTLAAEPFQNRRACRSGPSVYSGRRRPKHRPSFRPSFGRPL